VAGCDSCRRALDEQAVVADELMTLAPEREPPVGFESRVLSRIRAGTPAPRRTRFAPGRRWLSVAAAVVATAAVTAVAMLVFSGSESSEVHSADLRGPGGVEAGTVLGYDGRQSWMFVAVAPRYRAHAYRCELVTNDGRRIRLRAFRLDARRGSWGAVIPVDIADVAEVRVSGERGQVLRAVLD
jgi:hypothetical protein